MMEEAVAIGFHDAKQKAFKVVERKAFKVIAIEQERQSWLKFVDECYHDMPIDIKITKDAKESYNKRKQGGSPWVRETWS